jgi:hypothetical protein
MPYNTATITIAFTRATHTGGVNSFWIREVEVLRIES